MGKKILKKIIIEEPPENSRQLSKFIIFSAVFRLILPFHTHTKAHAFESEADGGSFGLGNVHTIVNFFFVKYHKKYVLMNFILLPLCSEFDNFIVLVLCASGKFIHVYSMWLFIYFFVDLHMCVPPIYFCVFVFIIKILNVRRKVMSTFLYFYCQVYTLFFAIKLVIVEWRMNCFRFVLHILEKTHGWEKVFVTFLNRNFKFL